MGLMSASISVTRYKVEGDLEEPVISTTARGLTHNAISDIDDDAAESVFGWTSFEDPFQPDFDAEKFHIGPYFIFSLRIDKKSIPAKVVKKHYQQAAARHLRETGREYLLNSEKKSIKEHVIHKLCLRVPATPNVYDLVWGYENGDVWFFSNLKSANEALETLFTRSFNLRLIRLFPFTMADMTAGLSTSQRDELTRLSAAAFHKA